MRIGIDIRNIGKKRTGDEVVFFNLVKNLAQIDTQNKYYLFTDILDEQILGEIKIDLGITDKNNFQIVPLKARNKFSWNFCVLSRYLKKNPVDVYHTQYILPFCVPKNIKLVTTIHDVSYLAYPEHIKFSDLFFLKILIPWSLKHADKIIAVSEFTKNEIIKYYKISPEKIEVVYNAVGDNFFQEISAEKLNEIKIKYGLPDKFILYLGTLQPRKNLPVLIEAFASSGGPKTYNKLVLCGNREAHNFDKRIDAAIEKFNLKDTVIFTGFISEEDKPAFYKLASVFCFPSLYEGFGIPILEAMQRGLPVIASNIAPHQEIALNGALFFDPQDPAELSKKIISLAENKNLAAGLVAAGLERIKHFSWKISAEKMLKTYQKFQ